MRQIVLALCLLAGAAGSLQAQPVDPTGSRGVWTPDLSSAGALGALNAAVTVNIVAGRQGVGGYVTTGTLSGTITPEVTINGTNWIATSVYNLAAGAAPTKAATVTLNTLFQVELPAGAKSARLRVSAYTSGTSTGTLTASATPGTFVVSVGTGTVSGTVNQGTPAATANRWPVQLTDGTDLALVTAAGEQNVLATAQPGVDIGDVTVNNAAGASAVNVQDGGNSLTVDNAILSVVGGGAEATAQRVTIANDSTGTLTVNTELPAAAALADNTPNPTVPGVGVYLLGYDGSSQWDRVGVGSSSGLRIENPSPGLVRVGVGVTGVADDPVIGEDSAFAANTATMVAGAQRQDAPSNDTTTDGDVAPIKGDANGRLWTNPHGPVATATDDGSCATVNGTASTVVASSATRRGFMLLAAPANSTTVFVKFGTTATTGDWPLAPGASISLTGPVVYTGNISAVTALASLSLCMLVW